MPNQNSMAQFDLTPHPRILPMLGEIVLNQWRCLAELIDNSIDAFLEAARSGSPIQHPKVSINIPTRTSADAQICIRDNGIGMDAETLERAARAGWTSHDPINNLGLFGMGFNIATARLGQRTIIWTTKVGAREWIGLEIDFDRLRKGRTYATPVLTRPKIDTGVCGTEIVIERLKSEQLDWFSKSTNRTAVSKNLGRIYSAMLRPGGLPIHFDLEINGTLAKPKLHCIWGGTGNVERFVESNRLGTVSAFQPIDANLGSRPFCKRCWNWLGASETSCPQCETDGEIINRDRKVHGWIGIQRYLDTDDYGIDFLRNGRKIEIGDKELFNWIDPATESKELEYPIDDPRNRGRIVGEIHIDHCRVPYTKDKFVRQDAAWSEMIQIVRGNSPLRPEIARERGFGENSAPLAKLFHAFRRSNPHNRSAGGWAKLLVVPDNDRATEMAKRYDANEVDYLSDAKWYALAEEEDNKLLFGGSHAPVAGQGPSLINLTSSNPPLPGIISEPHPPPLQSPLRTPMASLTQVYIEGSSQQRFDVRAYSVEAGDPDIQERAWNIRRQTAGHYDFLVDQSHDVFRSATFTPLDALLAQLAWQVIDFSRTRNNEISFPTVLARLRNDYAKSLHLDPIELTNEARQRIAAIAQSVVGRVDQGTLEGFFNELGPAMRERILSTMAQRSAHSPQNAVHDGRFLLYSPPEVVAEFIITHPEEFFDGSYWNDNYVEVNYGAANEIARELVRKRYASLLSDVVWLSEQTPDQLADCSREQLLRAFLAINLLAPSSPSALT